MATIVKRGNHTSIVYRYTDEMGVKHQRWERVEPGEDPEIKKLEIELALKNQEFIAPQGITVRELLLKFAKVQSISKWAFNTYSGNIDMMENHIFPYIGDREIQKVTPYEIEELLIKLRKVRVKGPKSCNKPEEEIPFLSSTTIRHVYTLLNSAFAKAVEWKMIKESPVVCAPPKKNKVEAAIWAPDEVALALEHMEKWQIPL